MTVKTLLLVGVVGLVVFVVLDLSSAQNLNGCQWTECQRPKRRVCSESTMERESYQCPMQPGWKKYKCCPQGVDSNSTSCSMTECYPDFTPGCYIGLLQVQVNSTPCPTAEGWTKYYCCPRRLI